MRPRWENKKAVFELIKERLSEQESEYVASIFGGPPHRLTEAQLRVVDPPRDQRWDEQSAVEAAKGGNLRPLVSNFLEPEFDPDVDDDGKITSFTYKVNDQIAHLKPETWFLICEFLLGERSLKNGRRRDERNPHAMRGPPKTSAAKKRERRAARIKAANFRKAVQEILRREFPKEGAREIRHRAREFAEVHSR